VISRAIKKEGKESAVIFTTHSMDEAEAISSKITIMVRGLFKCLGTPAHIKEMYGRGFEIYFTLDMEVIKQWLFDTGKAAKSEFSSD